MKTALIAALTAATLLTASSSGPAKGPGAWRRQAAPSCISGPLFVQFVSFVVQTCLSMLTAFPS